MKRWESSMRRNEKANNTKLLQIYIDPKLNRALQLYCLDEGIKNAPLVRELLTDFLIKKGYVEKKEN